MSVGISPGRTLRTVAGVVTFHPERSRLLRLISSTAGDVSRIIVFANSPLDAELKNAFSFAAKDTPVTVVSASMTHSKNRARGPRSSDQPPSRQAASHSKFPIDARMEAKRRRFRSILRSHRDHSFQLQLS